jgi:hypothetical protein
VNFRDDAEGHRRVTEEHARTLRASSGRALPAMLVSSSGPSPSSQSMRASERIGDANMKRKV